METPPSPGRNVNRPKARRLSAGSPGRWQRQRLLADSPAGGQVRSQRRYRGRIASMASAKGGHRTSRILWASGPWISRPRRGHQGYLPICNVSRSCSIPAPVWTVPEPGARAGRERTGRRQTSRRRERHFAVDRFLSGRFCLLAVLLDLHANGGFGASGAFSPAAGFVPCSKPVRHSLAIFHGPAPCE